MTELEPARIVFEQLTIRSFRNLDTELEPGGRLNVISGDNGHGKTSVLEAIYAVATTKSFRAERQADVIRTGADVAVVRARVSEDGHSREQRVAFEPSKRSVLVDGKKPERLASYATRTPVVVFHPGDLVLVGGPASGRRTLLDRLALFIDPPSADHRRRYVRAARERQRALAERGTRAPDLDAYEELMVRHGVRLAAARRVAAERLAEHVAPTFGRIAPVSLELAVELAPGGTEDPEAFASELVTRRPQDQRRKTASFGPQRDDLDLRIDGRSARRHASQGQQRLLTLALKVAELACIREARRAHPVLLLDDFSSELDPTRTGAVYDLLRLSESQVFVTTTRASLFPTLETVADERVDWVVRDGRVLGPHRLSDG